MWSPRAQSNALLAPLRGEESRLTSCGGTGLVKRSGGVTSKGAVPSGCNLSHMAPCITHSSLPKSRCLAQLPPNDEVQQGKRQPQTLEPSSIGHGTLLSVTSDDRPAAKDHTRRFRSQEYRKVPYPVLVKPTKSHGSLSSQHQGFGSG
jgi:hypothetical protein